MWTVYLFGDWALLNFNMIYLPRPTMSSTQVIQVIPSIISHGSLCQIWIWRNSTSYCAHKNTREKCKIVVAEKAESEIEREQRPPKKKNCRKNEKQRRDKERDIHNDPYVSNLGHQTGIPTGHKLPGELGVYIMHMQLIIWAMHIHSCTAS